MAIGFDIEGAVGRELQKIQAGQVAGGVVEEHVFAAGVASIDASCVLRRVPAVDRSIELHAGVAAAPGGVGYFVEQFFGFESVHRSAITDGTGAEVGVAEDGVHEVVRNTNGIVGVLEEYGRVGFGVGRGAVVTGWDQVVSFGVFFGFALDEIDDIGMVDVEDDHLGSSARLATGFDDAGESVEAFHEAEWAAGGASAA